MSMTKTQRDAVREKIRLTNPNTLRQALYSVVHHAGKAAADEVDNPDDESLGWYADGMETAVDLIWRNVSGGAPLPGEDEDNPALTGS